MKPELTKYELTEIEIKVLNHLETGHNNAISLKNLCLRTGEKERQIRLAIESLRNQGYIILFFPTLPQGYGMAETEVDVTEFIDYMRERVKSECIIIRSIKVAAKKKFMHEFGQLPLGFMG